MHEAILSNPPIRFHGITLYNLLIFLSDLHPLCLLPTRRTGKSNRGTWQADLHTRIRVAIFSTSDYLMLQLHFHVYHSHWNSNRKSIH
jgi:hypothetical protein